MTPMEHQYKIPTFEEALAICAKESGFSHSVQEIHGKEVHSFKYNLSHKEMWEDLSDGRLNMRGLTFVEGKLVALPPWKFFNFLEVPKAVYPENVKYLMNKLDGSCISAFLVDNILEIKTMKSVYSEVAIDCRKYFQTRPDIQDFARELISRGISPYFEYIGNNKHRIVLRYEKEDMVFLGSRNMTNGEMIFPWEMSVPSTITVPALITDQDAYLNRDDVEGLVVVGDDNHLIKLKTKLYCQLHKILDMKTKKNYCEYYIEHGNFDDVIGVLTHHGLHKDVEDLKEFEEEFIYKQNDLINHVISLVEKYGDLDRKHIALSMIDDNVHTSFRGLVFSSLDKKDIIPKLHKMILEGYKDEQRREED